MSLSPDRSPGKPSKPGVTSFQLQTTAGAAWADVELAEKRQYVRVRLFDPKGTSEVELADGTRVNSPYVATINVEGASRKPFLRSVRARRAKVAGRSRPQAQVTLSMRDKRREEWLAPETNGRDRLAAIDSEAGWPCATVVLTPERKRVSVLDRDGNSRVVLSIEPQPTVENELFRGFVHAYGAEEPMLHLLIVDVTVPAGGARPTKRGSKPR